MRELPGPGNSMGRVKFGFPNAYDIYLHDTPNKELFAQDDRDRQPRLHSAWRMRSGSRTGCSGATRRRASKAPEQNVTLPTPVPIYITYLTAQAQGGQLIFVDDIYARRATPRLRRSPGGTAGRSDRDFAHGLQLGLGGHPTRSAR